MSYKPKNPQNAFSESCFILLLKRDETSAVVYSSENLSLLASLDLRDYAIPFNTVLPMAEFDNMTQVIEHYNEQLAENKVVDQYGKIRQIQPQDIILSSFRQKSTPWIFSILLKKMSGKSWTSILKEIKHIPEITPGPGSFAGRFNTLNIVPLHSEVVTQELVKYKPNVSG